MIIAVCGSRASCFLYRELCFVCPSSIPRHLLPSILGHIVMMMLLPSILSHIVMTMLLRSILSHIVMALPLFILVSHVVMVMLLPSILVSHVELVMLLHNVLVSIGVMAIPVTFKTLVCEVVLFCCEFQVVIIVYFLRRLVYRCTLSCRFSWMCVLDRFAQLHKAVSIKQTTCIF